AKLEGLKVNTELFRGSLGLTAKALAAHYALLNGHEKTSPGETDEVFSNSEIRIPIRPCEPVFL
ncbi:hypothetical protein, partial [Parasutterella sp.]|uniref:hypothetical protein n=1 Tax=Parasutterella sp. TaxID=2049037 RepID=UPI00307AAB49